MFRHIRIIGMVLGSLVLATGAQAQPADEADPRPPNVVIIFTDDMGYADIDPFSEVNRPTPNLNAMANEGAVFTSFYVAQPACSASLASLLTGSYANRVGIEGALFPDTGIGLAQAETTLAELLKAEGLDDNTLVIFTSDNGPWLAYGNHAGSAGPFREGKNTVFEGGVRVPLVVRWPERVPAGYRSDTPFMSIDLLPTIARLTGADLPERPIDGKDAWPVLSGESERSPQEAYFFYYGDNELQGVRYGPWKLYYPHSYPSLNGREGGMDGAYGNYEQLQIEMVTLYNLEIDPTETRNVASEHPAVVEHINALGDRMRQDLGDGLRDIEGTGRRPTGTLD